MSNSGLMAWRVPQVLGVGYGYVGDALNGRMALEMMALLVLLKLVGAAPARCRHAAPLFEIRQSCSADPVPGRSQQHSTQSSSAPTAPPSVLP